MFELSLENKENFPHNAPTASKLPLQKNVSYYFLAKDAEFQLRNLKIAEFYYSLAIKHNERVDSAVKDLATVMHQRGRTEEACTLLEKFKPFYRGDCVKYENLVKNLKKQIQPTGNCLLKKLLVVISAENEQFFANCEKVKQLFSNFSRVQNIEFVGDHVFLFGKDRTIFEHCLTNGKVSPVNRQNSEFFCYLLSFKSFSQAKKTLDTLKTSIFPVFWVSDTGRICSKATRNQGKVEQKRSRANFEPVWQEVLCFSPQNRKETQLSPKSLHEIWENSLETPEELPTELVLLEKLKENAILLEIDHFFPSFLSRFTKNLL